MKEILNRHPKDLALHPLLKTQPWMAPGEFDALCESIRTHGVMQPVLITTNDEVVDGRHRWKAARANGLTEIPCEVVNEEDAASLVLTMVLDRRHYSKSGRAYLALPLFQKAREEGIARRAANLKAGANSRNPTKLAFGEKSSNSMQSAVEEFAEKLGISSELFRQARDLEETFFAPQDKVIEKWLEEHPDDEDLWELWRDDHPANAQPWCSWRAARLVDMGEKPQDPHTIHLIPENWREVYEFMIFNDEISLGGAIQALKGKTSTKGNPRGDMTEDPARVYTQTLNRVKQMNQLFFGRWDLMPEPSQGEVAREMARVVAKEWPESVRRVVFAQLREVIK